jgi:hypothetical protein
MISKGNERARLQRKLKDCLYWAQRRSAIRPTLPKIDIDIPYLERLWRRQKGSCALTGVPLELTGAFGITIDRTNPARGYTRRNVRLVGRSANAAKHGMTTAEFHNFIIKSYRWLKRKKAMR